jgi:hypothetical protein
VVHAGYMCVKCLGEGTTSYCYLVEETETNRLFVAKVRSGVCGHVERVELVGSHGKASPSPESNPNSPSHGLMNPLVRPTELA